jgi:hypothetical protein
MQGIGAGNADGCEVNCESVYEGYSNWGCSDCGPGVGKELLPGATVDIPWDRRLYAAHVAPAACSGNEDDMNNCALGTLADASLTEGTLEICPGEGNYGYCGSDAETFDFKIDLNSDELRINVE